MGRLVALLLLLGAAVPVGFAAALAKADAETGYYTLVAVQLLLVIVAVVLVSTLFTVVYLLGFGRAGRRLIADRLPVFVGWKLLRSQRSTPTLRTRLERSWHALLRLPRRAAVAIAASGLGLAGAAIALEYATGAWNEIAEAMSPAFVRWLQIDLVLVGAILLAAALPSLALPLPDREVTVRLRARTGVTLTTFISIVGVSIGTWALIVVLSVMHGFEGDLREKILRTNAHIVVEPEEGAGVLGDPFALEDAVRAVPGVEEVLVFAHGEVMMASSTNIAVNVVVKGVEPEALAASAQIRGRVSPGSIEYLARPEGLVSDRRRYPLAVEMRHRPLFESGEEGESDAISRGEEPVLPGILLGSELALSLHVDVGSDLQVISPDGDVGPTGLRPKLRSFRVAGVFTTGMYEYDQKLAYLAEGDAQRFFNLGNDLNRVEVRVAAAELTAPVLAALRDALSGPFPHLRASDWQERNKSLFSALQLERFVMFIVLGFIILVASLLIVSSLVMLIVEKAREIAVLKALGASNRAIVTTFLVLGGVIGLIGTASGVTLGVGTCLAIARFGVPLPKEYYISDLPVEMDPLEVTVVGLSALAICLLATIYPAREAAALRPVEGLRHG